MLRGGVSHFWVLSEREREQTFQVYIINRQSSQVGAPGRIESQNKDVAGSEFWGDVVVAARGTSLEFSGTLGDYLELVNLAAD